MLYSKGMEKNKKTKQNHKRTFSLSHGSLYSILIKADVLF